MSAAARGQKAKKSGRDKKRRRGVLDAPKAIEERLAEGRANFGIFAAPDRRLVFDLKRLRGDAPGAV